MSLIAPLFLLGLFSIALPIWLHRMNTLNPERHAFPSAMLLEHSKRTLIQKKLKYLLLMALRIGFLGLLIFAFAKPLISRPPVIAGGEGAILHMIVIDTSFSMKYSDQFNQAMGKVSEILNELEADDAAQLIAASNTIEVLMDPAGINFDFDQVLGRLQPGFGRLEMGNVIASIDQLVSEIEQTVELHLISDFQESALPSKFSELVPDALKTNLRVLNLHQISQDNAVNAYIDTVVHTENGIEVAVRTYQNDGAEGSVEIMLNGESINQETLALSDTGLTIFEFSIDEIPEGENRLVAKYLNDDSLDEDNIRYYVLDNTPPKPVLLLTENTDALSVKYLTAAVESGQQGYRIEAVRINELDPRIIKRYPWILIDDLGLVNETLEPVITEYLNNGGAIFAALGTRAAEKNTIPVVNFDVSADRLASDITAPYTVSAIDLSHPALAETSGWRDINVTRFLGLDVGNNADVIVTLEDGSPLVIEKKIWYG